MTGLRYIETVPSPSLRGVLRCAWAIGGTGDGRDGHAVLPDGCADLLFELDGEPRASWVGTMTRPLPVQRVGRVDLFGLRFAPGGLHAATRMSLSSLTDQRVPVEDAPLGWATRLATQLGRIDGFAQRVRLAEATLANIEIGTAATRAVRLLDALSAARELPGVRVLARHAGTTERTLERRFRDWVGTTPKAHLRYLRFERAQAQLAAGRPAAQVAAAVGYADQAHLIREFARFAGRTPARWLALRSVGIVQSDAAAPV